MFILTTLEDVIRINPSDFTKPSRDAIEDNVNALYANKVLHKVGLCICFYDLLNASDGLIASDRSDIVHVKVTFRLVVFRPFRGEVLNAKVTRSTKAGIHLHTEFFSNIFVAGPQNLFPDSHFTDEGEDDPVWIWEHDSGPFYFDKNELVRFRVEEEIWTDLSPRDEEEIEACRRRVPLLHHRMQQLQVALMKQRPNGNASVGVAGKQVQQTNDERQIVDALAELETELRETEAKAQQRPWRILGSMSMGGLGLLKWWAAGEDS